MSLPALHKCLKGVDCINVVRDHLIPIPIALPFCLCIVV